MDEVAVKTEPAVEEEDDWSLDIVKQEMDIGPIRLQRADRFYNLQPVKSESVEERSSVGEVVDDLNHAELSASENSQAENETSSVQLQVLAKEKVNKEIKFDLQSSQSNKKPITLDKSSQNSEDTYDCDSSLVIHLLNHNKISNQKKLRQSYRSLTELKPHKCTVCFKRYIFQKNLTNHIMRMHTLKKPNECSVCKKIFSSKGGLNLHKKIHMGDEPYECSICKKGFSNEKKSIQHKRRIHAEVKPFECSHCQKCWISNHQLSMHLLSHTSEKLYECSQCLKKVKYKSSLLRHAKVHADEKRNMCSICHKKFRNNGELLRHMSHIHTGDMPYECSVCNKRFLFNSALLRHTIVHTGEKPYECPMSGTLQ